jgi:hypothetical protein
MLYYIQKNTVSAAITFEQINKILKLNPERIGEIISFVIQNQENIFQAFQFCTTDDIFEYVSQLLTSIIKKAPSEAHFIAYFLAHLDEMINSWRRLPFIAQPIKKYISIAPLSTEIKAQFLQLLIDFILQLFSGKRNPTFLQELDLEDILDSISLNFQYITKPQFHSLFSKSLHILSSHLSSVSFLKFIFLGIAKSFTDFPVFLSFIKPQKSTPLEDQHINLIMAVILLSEDRHDLLSKLTFLEQSFIPQDIIETILQFSHYENFKEKLIDHSSLLLFPYLID